MPKLRVLNVFEHTVILLPFLIYAAKFKRYIYINYIYATYLLINIFQQIVHF